MTGVVGDGGGGSGSGRGRHDGRSVVVCVSGRWWCYVCLKDVVDGPVTLVGGGDDGSVGSLLSVWWWCITLRVVY